MSLAAFIGHAGCPQQGWQPLRERGEREEPMVSSIHSLCIWLLSCGGSGEFEGVLEALKGYHFPLAVGTCPGGYFRCGIYHLVVEYFSYSKTMPYLYNVTEKFQNL